MQACFVDGKLGTVFIYFFHILILVMVLLRIGHLLCIVRVFLAVGIVQLKIWHGSLHTKSILLVLSL